MATRKPRPNPPRTRIDWEVWVDACIRTNRQNWVPGDEISINWPEGFFPEVGPGWIPLAENHPFKGTEWCWRCIAEAQGIPVGAAPHRTQAWVICWRPEEPQPPGRIEPEQASRDPSAEDGKQDQGPARDESSTDWFQAGRDYVRPPDLTDTGQGFWPPVTVHEEPWAIGPDGRYQAPVPSPEPWSGFPSWTDDAPAAEPVPADVAERAPLDCAQPVPADEADDADRQPGKDET